MLVQPPWPLIAVLAGRQDEAVWTGCNMEGLRGADLKNLSPESIALVEIWISNTEYILI